MVNLDISSWSYVPTLHNFIAFVSCTDRLTMGPKRYRILEELIMSLLSFLFGKNSTNYNTNQVLSTSCQHVVDSANAFTGFCRKINTDRHYFSISFKLGTTSGGTIELYATHRIYDNNTLLEVAHDCAMRNDRIGLETTHKMIIEAYDLTPTELGVLQDASDFADFLRGEIPGFISCKRSGSDFEITRTFGIVSLYEKDILLAEIKKSLLSSYSDMKIVIDSPVVLSIGF